MPSPAVEDPTRLRAVERSGLVDSAREPVFDELAALAAQMLDAPFAFVTAVDAERSFWKSAHGIVDGTRANAVEDSFCQYVIDEGDELIVGDAANHPITAENPSIDSMGVAAWAGCPVVLDGETLGTFCVVDQRTRVWTERDRTILRMLAATVNVEIGRRGVGDAQLDVDRDQLDLLRASLLPAELAQPPGLDIAAWHRPPSDSVLLGDFYDVIDLGGNRSLLVIGDVCGHGRAAAELTTLLLDTIRSDAERLEQPAEIIDRCNVELLRSTPDQGRFATASVAVLEWHEQHLVAHITSAGHPAMVVRHADGSVTRLPAPDGPPLGVVADITYGQRSHRLEPGTTLIGFTDGATECRDAHGDQLGIDGLEAMVASSGDTGSAAEMLDRLSSSILSYATRTNDDIALIAVRLAD